MDGHSHDSETDVLHRDATEGLRPDALSETPNIVIGGGPAGQRAAQELAKRSDRPVVIFSDEKWGYYNRIKLTPLLARDVNIGQVCEPLGIDDLPNIYRLNNRRISSIDTNAKTVSEHGDGTRWPYHKLVVATGSRARRPVVPGLDRLGVFTFRSLNDIEALQARLIASRHVLVMGAGLLGLEAARGVKARGVDVTVVEHSAYPMFAQLDEAAGAFLTEKITELGINLKCNATVREVLGERTVEGVRLAGDEFVSCDTIIVCTGVQPNKEIALEAGLKVGRGILVDDSLRTSNPDIYAVGECAEFNQFCEGLVAPGLEQARVAAMNIIGEDAHYARKFPTVKLKVAGAHVFSCGDISQLGNRNDLESQIYSSTEKGVYRRLVFHRGRLVGAIAIGEWNEAGRVQQAVVENPRFPLLQMARFRRQGKLFVDAMPESVAAWPEAATVCNCTGVTRGQLSAAIAGGNRTVAALSQATSASTVCGTCQPKLIELLEASSDTPVQREPVKFWKALTGLGIFALLGALVYALLPAPQPPQSFTTGFTLDRLWTDNLFKQFSGYSLLFFSVLAAVLGLRKRIIRINLGDFGVWRLIHTAIGVLAVVALAVHSGFSLGANANFALIAAFLATIAAGAISAGIIASEHQLTATGVLKPVGLTPRELALWIHILACWPLPLLLIIHIISVYFF